MLKKLHYFSLTFLFVFSSFKSVSTDRVLPHFEYLGLKQGLSHLVVRDALHSEQGFIWFATDVGLNRYEFSKDVISQYF